MPRPTFTHQRKYIVQWAFLVLFVCLVLYAIFGSAAAKSSEIPSPFDHSSCQYPNRTTNPPNACDNTDPCDPETVKFGSGECTDLPKSQPEPMSHNINLVENPVETVDNWGK